MRGRISAFLIFIVLLFTGSLVFGDQGHSVFFKNGKTLICDKAWGEGDSVFLVVHGKDFAVCYDKSRIDMEKSFDLEKLSMSEATQPEIDNKRETIDKSTSQSDDLIALAESGERDAREEKSGEATEEVGVEKELSLPRHTVKIGPEISYLYYKEPDLMKESGVMYGINCSYTYHNNYMLRLAGKFSRGKLDYSSSDTGHMDNITNKMIELRGVAGYDFHPSSTAVATPYIGICYRYLNDDSGGKTTSTGALGYERESRYYYSPIGLETHTKLNDKWSIGTTVEFDYFWDGEQKSHLGDTFKGFNCIENDQDKGYGLRGALRFRKKRMDVQGFTEIELFMKYWNIKKSDEDIITIYGIPVGQGWEPKNSSREIGLMVSMGF